MEKNKLVQFFLLFMLVMGATFLLLKFDHPEKGVVQGVSQPIEDNAVKTIVTQFSNENEPSLIERNLYSPALVEGNSIVFSVTSKANGLMDSSLFQGRSPSGTGLDTPIVLDSEGLLYLHVYEMKDNHWLLGGMLKMQKLTVNQVSQPYINMVSHPFALSIKKNGEIFDLIVRKNSLDTSAEQFVQLLLSQFQFITPLTNQLEWATNESDTNGVYSARYKKLPVTGRDFWDIEKKIIDYAPSLPQPRLNMPSMQLEAAASSKKMKAAEDGWIKEINSAETTRLYVGGVLANEMSGNFIAQRTQQYPPYFFPKTRALLMVKIAKQSAIPAGSNTLAKMAEGKNLEQALDLFTTLLEDSNKEGLGRKFIINYLRTYADLSDELADKLNQADSGLDQDTEVFLWYALAKAGAELNQAALMASAQDVSAPASTRLRALAATHSIEAPVSNTISALWSLENDVDAEVANMAVLALGTLASTSTDVVSSSPEALIDQLGSRLNAADETEDIKLYLSALNNSANPASLALIAPYFTHDDVIIRGEAFNAAANVGTAAAFESVFDYYEKEAEVSVKVNALNGLARYKEQPMVNEWVVEQLNKEFTNSYTEKNIDLSLVAVDMVGGSIDINPDNEQFLRDWALQLDDAKLVKRIYQYVSP